MDKKALSKILSTREPAPFSLKNTQGKTPGIIICDHASKRVPTSLKGLGIDASDLNRHIGWDIGTEDMGLYISKVLDMPAIFATYSRLVLDMNRAPDHPELIIEESDHTVIPANQKITQQERKLRIKEIYMPYQAQVKKQIDVFLKRKQLPILIAIHSFTPEMDDKKRPWHIGVLWNKQKDIAKKFISELRSNHSELLIGENEPYDFKEERFMGSTISYHAEACGGKNNLPYLFIEMRQDLVDTKEKAEKWADILIEALRPLLGNIEFYFEDQ